MSQSFHQSPANKYSAAKRKDFEAKIITYQAMLISQRASNQAKTLAKDLEKVSNVRIII